MRLWVPIWQGLCGGIFDAVHMEIKVRKTVHNHGLFSSLFNTPLKSILRGCLIPRLSHDPPPPLSQLQPCLSYSRCRDHIDCVLLRSLDREAGDCCQTMANSSKKVSSSPRAIGWLVVTMHKCWRNGYCWNHEFFVVPCSKRGSWRCGLGQAAPPEQYLWNTRLPPASNPCLALKKLKVAYALEWRAVFFPSCLALSTHASRLHLCTYWPWCLHLSGPNWKPPMTVSNTFPLYA